METDGLVIEEITPEDEGEYVCQATVADTSSMLDRQIRVEVQSTYSMIPEGCKVVCKKLTNSAGFLTVCRSECYGFWLRYVFQPNLMWCCR